MKRIKLLLLFAVSLVFFSQLNAQETARLQVIHNAADPAAASVDIYLDGTRLLDDFAFRAATPFIDAPANTPINIGVAPGTSMSVEDVLANFEVTLEAGKTYVVAANGVLDPNDFASNPDGLDIGFTIFPYDMGQEAGTSMDMVDLMVFHGATDAPGVDVIAQDVGTLVDNAAYGDFTGYFSVPAASYNLDITPAEDNSTVVATFQADLSGLAGGAAVVFASGFLTPENNQNGEGFGLFAALPTGDVVALPALTTARLQVIHNAADPGAASVDIYLGDTRLLDDFAFRAATPFIDAPANTPVNIGVAPGTSSSVNDVLASFEVTMSAGKTYVVMANGVLAPDDFAANPDGMNIGFSLYSYDMGREAGESMDKVDLNVFHGSTDAPAVDVIAQGVGTLVDNAAYGDFTGYFSVPAGSYNLDITPAEDNSTVVATFGADLSGLGGGAAVVFASGFLSPADNQNGEAFGLFAALPTGDVVALPALTTARLQVIHNAADPGAASVDIYLDETRLLDDFAFRAATPFIDAPANTPVNIGVAPGTSSSVSDVLASFEVTLSAGKTYVVMANGVLAPDDFAANPDGMNIGFSLYPYDMGREAGESMDKVDLNVFHGSTDAPAVDVIAQGVGTLVDNAAYGDFTGYFSVPAGSYNLDITPAEDNSTVVATFGADLSGLGGGAAVVFASGFLSPADNQNGEAFGLFAALPTGDVVALPALTTARLQVIHNAADPGAASVDIYLDETRLLDDFAFRAATPFIDAPANTPVNIGVAPGTSSSVSDVLASFEVTLSAGKTYVVMANGVLAPDDFAANPDGLNIGFSLYPYDMGREAGESMDKVDLNVFHGSTDAPAVDVIAQGVGTLVDNAAYGDFTGYFSVPAASFVLDITPAEDNNTVVASFDADLSGLGGGAAVVFASGFLTPENNQNGAGFGLYAALPTGDVVMLPLNTTAVERIENTFTVVTDYSLNQNYPNPFNPTTTISFSIPATEFVTLKIYNMLGQEKSVVLNKSLQAGQYQIQFDASDLSSGVYYYRLSAGNYSEMRRMTLLK